MVDEDRALQLQLTLHKAAVVFQTSRAISAVAILLCLPFLVIFVLQY